MGYKIIVSPRAQNEIINAMEFYTKQSLQAPNNFIIQLQKAYDVLAINPFFRICYKEVRVITLRRFPYSLFYVVDENENSIRVLSCFHNKRNPARRP
ncbi:type II toxin-antitoxin system RelE/ParE family toxin [Flavobacterium sp. GA093]|uniref:Type II toxin-antitoxin system RelE/ParE family toxin n=1 Tax=Flavobacterium hydrocarbonoxydans TaxID=2683249 RepID=A0A6I4NLR6_9FLAO|nr:type II toxin-antitoxin system RelE/ParE family toxin [Flavobacterium hydrocarbonoxydans]MWB95290.1 type II toxin-antitoxin system RelE/ParE family toxin [Flavobacterium hydrocarbonoxydans]